MPFIGDNNIHLHTCVHVLQIKQKMPSLECVVSITSLHSSAANFLHESYVYHLT